MSLTETIRLWILDPVLQKQNEMEKEIHNMAKTLADLQAVIQSLGTAIQADADQDQKVVAAVEALLAKIAGTPAATDFEDEVTAVQSLISTLDQSNASVQAELDKAAS